MNDYKVNEPTIKKLCSNKATNDKKENRNRGFCYFLLLNCKFHFLHYILLLVFINCMKNNTYNKRTKGEVRILVVR